MIPRFDFGHFFKFLASVGLALLIAAVAAPWLFATTNGALAIPQDDMSDLTPIAQNVLGQRQQAMQTIQTWLPLACILVAAAGVYLLVWGLIGWRKRQRVVDESEEVDLRTKSVTYEKLTTSEAEEKRREEVEEEVREEQRVTSTTGAVPAGSAATGSPPTEQAAPDFRDRMRERRETEAHVGSLLNAGFAGGLAVAEGVKVKTQSGSVARLDFLVEPSHEGTPWGQLAIELRFASPRILSTAVAGWLVSLAVASFDLARRKVYTGVRGRPVEATTSGVLLLLIREDQGLEARSLQRTKQIVQDVNNVLVTPVGVVLIPEREIAEMSPEALRALVADAWNSDGRAISAVD